VLARLEVAALDATTELDLLLGGEEGYLVDLLEVRFEAAFCGNGGSS
jgi:hypothetical protein